MIYFYELEYWPAGQDAHIPAVLKCVLLVHAPQVLQSPADTEQAPPAQDFPFWLEAQLTPQSAVVKLHRALDWGVHVNEGDVRVGDSLLHEFVVSSGYIVTLYVADPLLLSMYPCVFALVSVQTSLYHKTYVPAVNSIGFVNCQVIDLLSLVMPFMEYHCESPIFEYAAGFMTEYPLTFELGSITFPGKFVPDPDAFAAQSTIPTPVSPAARPLMSLDQHPQLLRSSFGLSPFQQLSIPVLCSNTILLTLIVYGNSNIAFWRDLHMPVDPPPATGFS